MTCRAAAPVPWSGGARHRYYTCLEHLYALSRVSDLLLVSFEPIRPELLVGGSGPVWPGEPWVPDAAVTAGQRMAWWQALGMTPIAETKPFYPFYHQIVPVGQAKDPGEPIPGTGQPC